MELSVIIVNWNSVKFLERCLVSIEQYTHDLHHEVIVIDSGSFDGCDRLLTESFPAVLFIQSDRNIGFAAANNAAFRRSSGRHVLFLNPDTELMAPALNHMHEFLLQRPDAGAVGVKLLNADGSLQTSCVQPFPTIVNQSLNADWLRERFPRSRLWGKGLMLDGLREPIGVEVVSGACLMTRRDAFEQVGGFSEDYFMYAEDLDLCHKLASAGFVNYCLPGTIVKHYGGASTDSAPSEFSVLMMRESIWQFLRKTRGAVYGSAYRVSTLLSALARLTMLLAVRAVHAARPGPARHDGAISKWSAVLAWSLKLRRAPHPR